MGSLNIGTNTFEIFLCLIPIIEFSIVSSYIVSLVWDGWTIGFLILLIKPGMIGLARRIM